MISVEEQNHWCIGFQLEKEIAKSSQELIAPFYVIPVVLVSYNVDVILIEQSAQETPSIPAVEFVCLMQELDHMSMGH